jgi:CRP-like cAMP-binding protein
MLVLSKNDTLRTIPFFHGMNDEEISRIAELCHEDSYQPGELCQKAGEPARRINFITKGKVGVEFHLASIAVGSKDIVMYTLNDGDVFGWSALIQSPPWSNLRVLEPTEVLWVDAEELSALCESDTRIGYTVMKIVSHLIASRLRRSRNAIVAIRGEW